MDPTNCKGLAFDYEAVFDVDDYMYFYSESLTDERSDEEVRALVSLSGRMHNRRIVIRNGVRKDKPFFVRMYNPTEIRDLLIQAGLEVYRMLGGWDAQPLSTESRRMVIIARKPEIGDR